MVVPFPMDAFDQLAVSVTTKDLLAALPGNPNKPINSIVHKNKKGHTAELV